MLVTATAAATCTCGKQASHVGVHLIALRAYQAFHWQAGKPSECLPIHDDDALRTSPTIYFM